MSSTTLPTLLELIDSHLPAAGLSRNDLADRLGVTRVTVSRWSNRLPSPEHLRALAGILDLSYGVVLASAMRSGGYAETTMDVLAGHRITLVARDPASVEGDEKSGAAFTDPDRAEHWRHVSEELDQRHADYGHGSVAIDDVEIDGAGVPAAVKVWSVNWRHSSDAVDVSEYGYFDEEPRFIRRGADDTEQVEVNVSEVRTSGLVYRLSAKCVDPEAGRIAVTAELNRLRDTDRLLPANERTGFGFTDELIHAEAERARSEMASCTARVEAMTDDERATAEEARKQLAAVMAALPQIPYTWGGGGIVDAHPGPDPIRTYTVHPNTAV